MGDEISQETARSYLRCFADMSRRMGAVGEAMRLHQDSDPTDIYAEAKALMSFVDRVTKYVRSGEDDLVRTAVARFWERRGEPGPVPEGYVLAPEQGGEG